MADELVELAYDEAREALREQDRTLGSIRNRAGTLLAAMTVVTSVAAAVGLLNVDPNRGRVLPNWAGWALLGVLVLTAISVLATLWPSSKWTFGPSPTKLLEQVGADVDKVLHAATDAMISAIAANERALSLRANGYRLSVLLVLCEVALLIVSLLLTGR